VLPAFCEPDEGSARLGDSAHFSTVLTFRFLNKRAWHDGRPRLASAGLGAAAGRSVLRQFDDVVATLELALDDLRVSHGMLAHCHSLAHSSSFVGEELDVVNEPSPDRRSTDFYGADADRTADRQAMQFSDGCNSSESVYWLVESRQRAAAMSSKLVEWRRVVTSHQSASRVLRWSASQVTTS